MANVHNITKRIETIEGKDATNSDDLEAIYLVGCCPQKGKSRPELLWENPNYIGGGDAA